MHKHTHHPYPDKSSAALLKWLLLYNCCYTSCVIMALQPGSVQLQLRRRFRLTPVCLISQRPMDKQVINSPHSALFRLCELCVCIVCMITLFSFYVTLQKNINERKPNYVSLDDDQNNQIEPIQPQNKQNKKIFILPKCFNYNCYFHH